MNESRESDAVGGHVALLTRLRDGDTEYLADRPDGDPRWRAAKSARIEALTAAIAAMQAQQGAEPVAWIHPGDLHLLDRCRNDDHNGKVHVWMREEPGFIPLCIAATGAPR